MTTVKTQKNISKYLKLYSESEASYLDAISHTLSNRYTHCIVIPCYDETIAAIERLAAHKHAHTTILIVVINAPSLISQNAANAHKNLNAALFEQLVGNTLEDGSNEKLISKHHNLFLTRLNALSILVVDRFHIGATIHKKKGVGLARKIGCDIACRLWQLGKLLEPIIYSSDADAHLPENYFHPLPESDANTAASTHKIGAYVFDFSHTHSGTNISNATQDYEKSIKYYRNGLLFANSPYAFFTLGSCIAINIEQYCQVRGFPPRAGGEDFYLLNKISKISAVHFFPAIKISIEARTSHRVPFGTGPAVQAILDANTGLTSYNPYIFVQLSTLLSWVHVSLPDVISKQQDYRLQLTRIPHFSPTSRRALDSLNFDQFLHHLHTQCTSTLQILKHFHIWFDGFKTLKFIHFLQHNGYPARPIDECISVLNTLKEQACGAE